MSRGRPGAKPRSEVTLDTLRAALPSLDVRPDDVVFLAGSRADGWNNRGSNFNLYCITADNSHVRPDGGLFVPGLGYRVRVRHTTIAGARVECQHWIRGDVESLADAIREHELMPFAEYWSRHVELVHRIRVGTAVQGEAGFAALRARFDFDQYQACIARFYMRCHESYYHDACCALDDDAVENATLMSQLAIDYATDAYLLMRGHSNPHPKWRHARLVASEGSDGALVRRYLATLVRPDFDDRAAVARHVLATLRLAESLNVCVQMGWDYGLIHDGAGRPARSRARAPAVKFKRRHDGTLALFEYHGRKIDINESAAVLWARADGHHSDSSTAAHLARLFELSRPRADRSVARFVATLEKHRLLQRS